MNVQTLYWAATHLSTSLRILCAISARMAQLSTSLYVAMARLVTWLIISYKNKYWWFLGHFRCIVWELRLREVLQALAFHWWCMRFDSYSSNASEQLSSNAIYLSRFHSTPRTRPWAQGTISHFGKLCDGWSRATRAKVHSRPFYPPLPSRWIGWFVDQYYFEPNIWSTSCSFLKYASIYDNITCDSVTRSNINPSTSVFIKNSRPH